MKNKKIIRKSCYFYNEEKNNCKCLNILNCNECKFYKNKLDPREIKLQSIYKREVIINGK